MSGEDLKELIVMGLIAGFAAAGILHSVAALIEYLR